MNDWNIQSRAHGCQACGQAFADQQAYHTLLFDKRQVFERLDICAACWEGQHSQGASDRKGFVSHWQGTYEMPPPPPPEAIKKENAESLLRKLIERNDARYAPATFILAVMLERKRVLKVKEQFHRDGQRVFVYEHPRSGDLFTIPDPNLQLNQLEEVQRDVAALLEHGLPDPGVMPAMPEPAAAVPEETQSAPAVPGDGAAPAAPAPEDGTSEPAKPADAPAPGGT